MSKSLFSSTLLLGLALLVAACDSSSNSDNSDPVVAQRVTELPADPYTGFAPSGQPITAGIYTFFSLRTNSIVAATDSASNAWDVAFKGTSILVNGGISGPGNGAAQVLNDVFSDIKIAPASGWAQDSVTGFAIPTGSGNGWYNYEPSTFTITPIPGRVILIRTADNRYAKISILSYYKGQPAIPDRTSESRFLTFDFVFQPDGTLSFE
mgnify:CR=1 FL=1|jgi:hypothetical protein